MESDASPTPNPADDFRWFMNNQSRLAKEFDGKFIVIVNKKVVSQAKTPTLLKQQLRKLGLEGKPVLTVGVGVTTEQGRPRHFEVSQ